MRRDRQTWFVYAAQTLFGFALYGSGSVTALVRAELDLGYLATGVLPALFTAGAIAGSALSGWLLRGASGRRREVRVLGAAALGIAAGAVVMALPGLWPVAVGLGLVGLAGGLVPPTGAVLLAARHGELAGRALLEVNVLGGMAGVVAAAALSGGAALGAWRFGLALPVAAGVALALVARRLQGGLAGASAAPVAAAGPVAPRRLPTPARWYVAVAVSSGVVEFSVIYWAADLVGSRTGLSAAASSGTLMAFTGGLVVGRAALSVLASSSAANRRIVQGSLLTAALGAGGLLLAGGVVPAVAALAVIGLGAAALYPVSLALAVAAAPGAGARASATLSVAVGTASLLAPVALAAGADAVGVRLAFAGVPVAALVGFLAARRASRAAGAVEAARALAPADPA